MNEKTVIFVPKKIAMDVKDSDPSKILISCFTPGKRLPVHHQPSWADILKLGFHDVDPSHMNNEERLGYTLFSTEQAVKILEFLKKHEENIDFFVVHCEAGISRSAAIAKFIAYIYNAKFPDAYSIYNKHVFSTLMRVYGEAQYECEGALLKPEDLPGIK